MPNLILHIPHASLRIPDYSHYLLPPEEVDAEALYLTDLYTDELFLPAKSDAVIQADFCRVYCDVERFDNDALEPMSKFGMGAAYVRCDDGRELRYLNSTQLTDIIRDYYEPHHTRLTASVDLALSRLNEARIIDCHSFPDKPLRCSFYQGDEKFDFNIGTDAFHTPPQWIEASIQFFTDRGFRLGIDEPYSGSLVPMKHYNNDIRVKSIMLEVNRTLYLNPNHSVSRRFFETRSVVVDYLGLIRKMCI